MKSRFAVVAAAVICLGTGIGSAVSAEAVSAPHASAGLLNESYTSARADFGITLSAEAGLASYDVRRADSSMLAGHRAAWAFPPKLQAVPVGGADASPRLRLPVSRGRVLCVSIRARGVDGTTGPWSEPSCAVRALDDVALVRRGHTRVVRDSRFWGGRASEIGRRGRMLLRRVPQGSRVFVIATDLNQNNPRYNGRNVSFTVPAARSVHTYSAGWRWGPTLYTQVTIAGRPSGRFGTVVFRHSGYPLGRSPGWTSPLEGVAIQPRWM